MKLIVFSDSHGREQSLERIYAAHPNAELYLHLGDGWRDAQMLRLNHPEIPLMCVSGNCDSRSIAEPPAKTVEFAGKKIFFTHGHPYSVKYGLSELVHEGRRIGAGIVLFGHTHEPFCETRDGMTVLNPGAASSYSGERFAIIDVVNGVVIPTLAQLQG